MEDKQSISQKIEDEKSISQKNVKLSRPKSSEKDDKIDKEKKERQIREYLDDIRRMLRYCRERGKDLDDKIEDIIADCLSIGMGEYTKIDNFKKIIKVHGLLSNKITPVTPRTLAATRISFSDWRSIMTHLLLLFFISAAIVGLVGYIMTLPNIDLSKGVSNQQQNEPDGNVQKQSYVRHAIIIPVASSSESNQYNEKEKNNNLQKQFNYLWAALIGSAFFGLLTMYGHIRDRTFDPNYISGYLIRFHIGAIAGVILANFGAGLFEGDKTIDALGPGVIALLGGYSAEVVREVLDRLVEVMLTVVKSKDTSTKQRMAIADDLLKVAAVAVQKNAPQEVKESIDQLLKKISVQ